MNLYEQERRVNEEPHISKIKSFCDTSFHYIQNITYVDIGLECKKYFYCGALSKQNWENAAQSFLKAASSCSVFLLDYLQMANRLDLKHNELLTLFIFWYITLFVHYFKKKKMLYLNFIFQYREILILHLKWSGHVTKASRYSISH